MLKFLLGFLAVANLLLFASNAGLLGAATADGREPNRAAMQLNAQRIVLIDPAPAGAAAGAGSAATAANAGAASGTATPAVAGNAAAGAAGTTAAADAAGAPSAVPTLPAPTVPAGSPPAGSTAAAAPAAVLATTDPAGQCVEIGNFDAAEAARFTSLVAPLAPGDRLTRRSVQEVERYIVYIPPLGDKESAERKAGELRRLGIDDFFIFNDASDLRTGISLGIFKSAEAANQHLATLGRKGVRSAKIAARVGAASKTVFQLRGLDPQGQAALTRIHASFPRQELRSCSVQ